MKCSHLVTGMNDERREPDGFAQNEGREQNDFSHRSSYPNAYISAEEPTPTSLVP